MSYISVEHIYFKRVHTHFKKIKYNNTKKKIQVSSKISKNKIYYDIPY